MLLDLAKIMEEEEEAVRMKNIMKKWFLENYDEPVNILPYESAEGGYIDIYGPLIEPFDILYNAYSNYTKEDTIKELANELEELTPIWSPAPDYNEYASKLNIYLPFIEKEVDDNLLMKINKFINTIYEFTIQDNSNINNEIQQLIKATLNKDIQELTKHIHQLDDLTMEYKHKQVILEKHKANQRIEQLAEDISVEFEEDKQAEKDKKAANDLAILELQIKLEEQDKVIYESKITTIRRAKNDNIYLQSIYNSIMELQSTINEIKVQISSIIELEDKIKYSAIIDTKQELLTQKIEHALKYVEESTKIRNAIKYLNTPSEKLEKVLKYAKERRSYFNNLSTSLFYTSAGFFGVFIVFFYIGYLFDFEVLVKSKSNITIYLFAVFPIVFTSLLGFLSVRQSNIKSNEITEANRRFILIHEVNQSLLALVEVYEDEDMNKKTEQIIDKLILNILNYASSNKVDNNSNEMFDINTKLDTTFDSIDKKISAISKTVDALK